MADVMKNRPLLSVDTAKQSFYDFILNLQVVGYGESKIEGQLGDPIVKPFLVHGYYQDIYNKLMNASLVIGAQVSLLVPGVSRIGQIGGTKPPLLNITKVFIDNTPDNSGHLHTVGGMPIIVIYMDDGDTGVCLDCLNRVWTEDDLDNIPFDT